MICTVAIRGDFQQVCMSSVKFQVFKYCEILSVRVFSQYDGMQYTIRRPQLISIPLHF